ncbi:MAG: hypothetical protein AB1861_28210 [Cyanobacteriota bacterium]
MAKQLNRLSTGQLVPTALHPKRQQPYFEYAAIAIAGRALPNVQDSLHPSSWD